MNGIIYRTNSRMDTLIKKKGQFLDESEQNVISSIRMFGANIEHSARNNYRPYLMLYGEISAVAFPNGRYQAFSPSTHVHVRYEFSDEELGQLATKGLFYDGFKCPDIITDNPNIEIPMTATARRYLLRGANNERDNLCVTLDLESAGIYETNTAHCGYIFADYFEEQIPSKLDNKAIQPENDVIPTFDEDFAAQFAKEFQDMLAPEVQDDVTDEETKKKMVQAEHQMSLVTADAQKLADLSPTARRQREMAAQRRASSITRIPPRTIGQPATQSGLPEISDFTDMDDEFAAFRRAQQNANMYKQQEEEPEEPVASVSEGMDESQAEREHVVDKYVEEKARTEGLSIDEARDEIVEERTVASDASVSVSVSDIDDDEDYGDDIFGSSFNDTANQQMADTVDMNKARKESIEEQLKSATSTKHIPEAQKLTTPDSSPDFNTGDDYIPT